MHEVLKKFDYAPSIYKTVSLAKGEQVSLDGGVIDGLTKEGFVKELPASKKAGGLENKALGLETSKPVSGLKVSK